MDFGEVQDDVVRIYLHFEDIGCELNLYNDL